MPAALHLIFALVWILLILWTLPLVLELLVLTIAAATPTHHDEAVMNGAESCSGPLAVVIPAHNEQELIAACVASLAGHREIYVVAHNCSDATAQRAAAARATVLVLNDRVGGKGTALDFGFRQAIAAGAEAVLVIDADSVAGPNLIAAVSAAFGRGADAVQCRYQAADLDTRGGANRRTRLAALALFGMNVVRPLGRHRLGLSCGIFGNGFALSAATLARVSYTPNSLVEDLEYHLHLIRAGIRVEFLDHAAVFGEMPETKAAASTQRARWEGGRILMRRQWTGRLLGEVLRGRLRMIEPLLDLLALPLTTEAALLVLGLAMGIGAHLRWLTLYSVAGLCTLVLYVVAAALLGPEPVRALGALASAPAFLVWKVLMIPRTRLAARGDAAWVRTRRNVESAESPDPPKPPL